MRETPPQPPITRRTLVPAVSCSATQRSIDVILARLRARRLKDQEGPDAS